MADRRVSASLPEAIPHEPLAARGEAGTRVRRILVIANPHASSTTEALRRAVVETLSARFAVDAVATEFKGHAIALSKDAAREGYDAVAALGGDGTINEVANGLVGSATALACLPGGATNVYCRMRGIPDDVLTASRLLLAAADAWSPVQLDVARVNDRWFTFSAGVGLDASVVRRVDRHPALKARWGPWFFAGVGLAVFLRRYLYNPPRLQAEADGTTVEGVSVLAQNGNPYTYFRDRPIVLVERAGLRSGGLDAVALRRARAIDLPPVLWRALSGHRPVSGHPQVQTIRDATELVVRATDGRPVPVQVDGDHIGDLLEVRFSLLAGGLRVLG